ncbi:MAG: DUF1573 domain-containing protein [Bacteroidetes bacterium]|nr:DUF1573 domain-containing protein [Bacteroidota bacterium]
MYGIFFFFFVILSGVEATAQEKKSGAFLKIKNPKYNFGFVKQGTTVKIEYEFTNSGTDTLRISTIEVTCGCTVGDFPHYPIKPGDSGIILLTFNTKEKYDRQDRTVDVISNASNSPTKLRFKGVIQENKSEKKSNR